MYKTILIIYFVINQRVMFKLCSNKFVDFSGIFLLIVLSVDILYFLFIE
jgi:hypothetical protein